MPRVFARVDDVYSLPFLIVEGGTITVKIPQINHNDSFSPSSSPSPSAVYPTEKDVLNKIFSSTVLEDHGNSRSNSSDGRRSYSIGSFDYIVDEGYETTWIDLHRFHLAPISSRTVSFSSSSRFFTGSSRQSNTVVAVDKELEANRIGEEISELFWWFSGL
ncbi:E3 ubiquitin-protein ligase ATL4 [Camellia lanceoleosa]|uniref:E3 ubiquitin-protein ligase ATL4 n=1 Tax=Camellia lanceoleosa TaxID=1840588 RepID=A0ACC0G2K0_9ERIC|nr:E3 ubiquitin-protein ligase ATL4 [Camellia lanceoleosa]